ncbi:MAG: alpha/beta hydrolase [Clostridia bacterium]|nr:alpha/beta hydrolase [Clostridia bacterium]
MSIVVNYLFSRGDKRRDAGLVTPADIERHDNIAYSPQDDFLLLDVYRPKNEKGKLPVIVSVHGGGWVYGNKEVYQHYCMSLAKKGFAVVNFNYRLAPKAKFMTIMEDVNSAFEWVIDNSEKYGMDTDNIFAVGDSAGAHLLGVYSALCTNPSYADNFAFAPPSGFAPKAIALNCGIYDINTMLEGSRLNTLIKSDLLPKKGWERQLELINFLPFITSDFPSTYIMNASNDMLVDYIHTQKLKSSLDMAGVSYMDKVYGDESNPLNHVFHCNIKTADAKICSEDECSYFKSLI